MVLGGEIGIQESYYMKSVNALKNFFLNLATMENSRKVPSS